MAKKSKIEISILTSLYRCEEYLERYFNHLSKIHNLSEVEIIFIHNDPLPNEKKIINEFISENSINYQYIEVPREGLYKSWNRGILGANGKYIAIWNVDDIRYPDSLLNQKKCLENNKDCKLTYGDKHIIKSINDKDLRLLKTEVLKNNWWYKKFQDGSLLMWRKEIHSTIGYFDEQFISLGDQDFWYRVVDKFNVIKCDSILGVFLAEEGKGISRSSDVPSIEKIIIGLRYGFYTGFDPWGWKKAFKNYNPKRIEYNNRTKEASILYYNNISTYIYSVTFILKYSVVYFFKK